MAEAGAGLSETVTETTVTVTTEPENRSLTIKLRKRKPEKKVEWTSDTVDNEHMGRRSSKCCCIYEKPRAFGESSTESDDEEEEGCGHTHCVRGHRKGRRHATPGPSPTTPPRAPAPRGGALGREDREGLQGSGGKGPPPRLPGWLRGSCEDSSTRKRRKAKAAETSQGGLAENLAHQIR
uniref:E3 ubiquitin-protein ligase PPP1R11 n=1 Tax=Capra hircus TaxID=9925 RepID=A0A8C2PCQ7_CAPHI